MKTKPFNLEEALAKPGRVICRDGVKPSDLHYFKQVNQWRFTRPDRANDVFIADVDGGCFSDVPHAMDLFLTCETKLVPFTYETCPVGRIVKHNGGTFRALLTFANRDNVLIGSGSFGYIHLLSSFTFEDGTPCGVEVEE